MSSRLRDSTPLDNIDQDAITPAPPRDIYIPRYRDELSLGNFDGQAEEPIRIASPPASPQQDDTEADDGPAVAQRRREPVSCFPLHDPKHFPHFDIEWLDWCVYRKRLVLGCAIFVAALAAFAYGLVYEYHLKPKEQEKNRDGFPNNGNLYL